MARLWATLLAGVILLTCCSDIDRSSPEATAKTLLQAVHPDELDALVVEGSAVPKGLAGEVMSQAFEGATISSSTIDGANATVDIELQPTGKASLDLVRVDGVWRIRGFERK